MKFQSTRPQGARLRLAEAGHSRRRFQSTRPQGARRETENISYEPDPFQSTRPQGARHRAGCKADMEDDVSIHAPARGATGARSGCRG